MVDTPGFYDTERSNGAIIKEIIKAFGFVSPGFHALLFVLSPGRFTNECIKIKDLYLRQFGPEVSKYTIIILTHADALERSDVTLQKYLAGCSKEFLDFLTKCNNRIIAFDNLAEGTVANRQVKTLLRMVDDICDRGKSCFTNNHLKLVKVYLKLERKRKRIKLEKARTALYKKAAVVLGIEVANVWNYKDNKPERKVVRNKQYIPELVKPKLLPPVGSSHPKKVKVVSLKNNVTNIRLKEDLQILDHLHDKGPELEGRETLHREEIKQEKTYTKANPETVRATAFLPEKDVDELHKSPDGTDDNVSDVCVESDEYVEELFNNVDLDTEDNSGDRRRMKEDGFFHSLLEFFRDLF